MLQRLIILLSLWKLFLRSMSSIEILLGNARSQRVVAKSRLSLVASRFLAVREPCGIREPSRSGHCDFYLKRQTLSLPNPREIENIPPTISKTCPSGEKRTSCCRGEMMIVEPETSLTFLKGQKRKPCWFRCGHANQN